MSARGPERVHPASRLRPEPLGRTETHASHLRRDDDPPGRCPLTEPSPPTDEAEQADEQSGLSALVRFGLVLVVLGGIAVVARYTGLIELLSKDALREAVSEAGAWGIVLFVVVFAVGQLVYVPGVLFLGVGVVLWGPLLGGIIGFGAGLTSVTASFLVVRGIGGKLLHRIDQPKMRKMLDKLEARPVRTVLVLRLLFFMSPPLNYALAMSNVSLRDYFIGSAVGLAPPVALVTGVVAAGLA